MVDGQETERPVPELRSKDNEHQSLVRFVNISQREVDIVWMNYEGQGVTYKTIPHKKSFDINTYVSHPWVVKDSKTQESMHLLHGQTRNATVLWPEGPKSNLMNRAALRRLVFITLPVFTLKERCFQIIRDAGVTKETFKELTLPKTLERDFVSFLKHEPI
jgi:von Hippel-Lindau disease tumor supressor